MRHKTIDTSPDVWAAIKKAHPELVVFSSYSAPDGDEFGNPDECVMMTELGFKGCDVPILGARTTWDKSWDNPSERLNLETIYWLCIGLGGGE